MRNVRLEAYLHDRRNLANKPTIQRLSDANIIQQYLDVPTKQEVSSQERSHKAKS